MSEYRAPEQDVVLSSRVRLARNYEDIPFSPLMNQTYAAQTIERASEPILTAPDGKDYTLLRMSDISEDAQNELVEHHLISYDLLKFADYSAALISSGKTVSVMINEEDHLRIQGLLPGMQLELAADLAFKTSDRLGEKHAYAFDAHWGFLTSCPTNTGTGMRASVMLHLPALTAARQINAVLQVFSKLGLTVRGLYGEGSDARGCLYQLSNQVTLGRSEEDMIRTLLAATKQISDHERALRETLRKKDSVALLDRLMRSVGIMAHAHVMSGAEFMQRYSDLRLAVSMGFVDAPLTYVDALMMDLQSGSLSMRAQQHLTEQAASQTRADLLRSAMAQIASHSA